MLLEKIRLEPDEKILIQTRRHWFIIVAQIASVLVLTIAPLLLLAIINALLATYANTSGLFSTYAPHITFIYMFWLIFAWISIFNFWTNYYLDVLTITDRRAILVNQKGLFRRNIASFRLERMQDMNVEIQGLIATLLDFGTVTVETAGHSDEEFKATDLPNPSDIKSLILQASDNRITTTANHDGIGE